MEIILIIITILFIAVLFIKRFLYFRPTRQLVENMYGFEDVYEGNLHAWYKKGNKPFTILFCHGNGGNLSYRQFKLYNLFALGYSVLIFDYNGYGKSKGIPNEKYCFRSADIFVSFLLRNGVSKNSIVPYGESLGACVASYIASKYNLSFLILESPFPGFKSYLPKLLKPLSFIFHEFNTEKYLENYKNKINKSLLIHSVHDEIIPFKSISNLRNNVSKVVETTGSHNSPYINWTEIDLFLKT